MGVDWQSIAVVVIVLAAVAFLVRRVIGRRKRPSGVETFVPIDRLRRKDDGCH